MQELQRTHPLHEQHPEHPANHHHRVHHPHAQNLRGMLAIFVLVVIIITAAVGITTNAPFGPVILFFAPSVLLGLIGIGLLSSDHFDIKIFGLILITIVIIAGIATTTIAPDVDPLALAATNLVLGAILLVLLSQSYHKEPTSVVEVEADQQEIPELIKTIEDRCKALNFGIGRVYNVHSGATKGLREKLKIDAEWYNELTDALQDPEKNKNIIVGVLEKIKRRLYTLEQTEKEVFSEAELRNLKRLKHNADGSNRIIDVLGTNDSDPVEGFHKAALEYCELLLERLQ